MFDKDFYPTPTDVIYQMIGGINLQGKYVLEPSAGKGDIVELAYSMGAERVDCFETQPDLQKIVSSKGNLIGSDFLESKSDQLSHIDCIIMNPPFSNDTEHILHAWKVAPQGCQIVSLCNWETLNNPFSRTRRQLENLIDNNGLKENLGDVFLIAERKTGVEVGMITLFKPIETEDFDFSGFLSEEEEDEGSNVSGLMPYNEVREIVQRYIGAVKTFHKMKELSKVMDMYVEPVGLSDGFSFSMTYGKQVKEISTFTKELQKKSWEWIFNKLGVRKLVTSRVMETINRYVETQSKYPFTMHNIYRMLEVIVATRGQTMDNAIIEAFDAITIHYHDNRYHVEGWKTNKHYLVGKRFILPFVTGVNWGGGFEIAYGGNRDKIDDLHKALVFISGQNKDTPDLQYFIQNRNSNAYKNKSSEPITFGELFDWGFFECRGYKKGTMHFRFKDDEVWAMFNRRVAEIKGFPLPEKL